MNPLDSSLKVRELRGCRGLKEHAPPEACVSELGLLSVVLWAHVGGVALLEAVYP